MNARIRMMGLAGLAMIWGFTSSDLRAQSSDGRPDTPGTVIQGKPLAPSDKSPGRVETLEECIARDVELRKLGPFYDRARNGEPGSWIVPSRRATFYPKSGRHNVTNKWGDTRMGIAFGQPTHVVGVYVAGQAAAGAWTTGLRALGYRDGVLVQQSDWFRDISDRPAWFAIDFASIDRLVFESEPVIDGSGWYALDDLTYQVPGAGAGAPPTTVVQDFETCSFGQRLTGSNFGGLNWESGTGEIKIAEDDVHAPQAPDWVEEAPPAGRPAPGKSATLSAATGPVLDNSFQGVIRGDAGSFSYPPDSCGAIGPNHFVEVVNRNFAIYDRYTGAELTNILLGAFLPGSNGDPRILYDQYSDRWIVLVSDFDTKIFIAVSSTSDPTGAWFKSDFVVSADSDAACWPDYQTLGVNENGIYTAAFMVECNSMSIFALDKAPLIAATQSLGTITAYRALPWEGAIQPAQTFGPTDGEYFLSRSSSTTLRLRKLTGSLSAPTLTETGLVVVPSHSSAPNPPALGSTTDIDSIDWRPLNAVYRNGSLWTTHDVNSSFGTAACRWYEIDPLAVSLVQSGTIQDSVLHYFYGSIAVNTDDNVVMAFSGSHANQFVGTYYTGRLASDPAGEMDIPVLLKAGLAPYNNLDSFGRNRWGDYSLTTVDPNDDRTFFTVQEYAHSSGTNDLWGTWIAQLSFCLSPPPNDCNGNCVDDAQDLASATSPDCNANGIPDECDLVSLSLDCNFNSVPDECEDCDGNGIADECDLSSTYSATSTPIVPLGLWFEPLTYTFVAPPPRLGDVTIGISVSADLAGGSPSSKTVEVFLNGTSLGEVFNSSGSPGTNCADPPDFEQIILTMSQFDLLVGTGDAEFELQALNSDPFACGGSPSGTISLDYESSSSGDANSNGILDICECDADCAASGPDTQVTVVDLLDLLGNWGPGTVCDIAPPGGDGQISVLDLLELLGSWGSCAP